MSLFLRLLKTGYFCCVKYIKILSTNSSDISSIKAQFNSKFCIKTVINLSQTVGIEQNRKLHRQIKPIQSENITKAKPSESRINLIVNDDEMVKPDPPFSDDCERF